MGIIDAFLRPIRRVLRQAPAASAPRSDGHAHHSLHEARRPDQPTDGHAPGHRHLGPPPEQAAPPKVVPEPQRDQPWVRRSHSDSQKRRPRR